MVAYLSPAATVYSGLRIRSDDGRHEATLGLLVVDGAGKVSFLTASAVAPEGTHPLVRLSGGWRRLGRAAPLTGQTVAGRPSILSLVSIVELGQGVQVSANVPGLGNQAGLVDFEEVFDSSLQLGISRPLPLGPVLALEATAFVRQDDSESARPYRGAVAVAYEGEFPDDLGGAVVVGVNGRLLGITAAVSRSKIYVAPLAEALAARGLRPLRPFDAASHNAKVLRAAARREEAARQAELRAPPPAVARAKPEQNEPLESEKMFAEADFESRFAGTDA